MFRGSVDQWQVQAAVRQLQGNSRVIKRCKDCGPESKRPAPFPGPRCTTCHRVVIKERKRRSHAAWILKTYGITIDQYEALYEAQGRTCYICGIARGVKKNLSVDHDHLTGYVRGLLCGVCNKFIGYIRDSPDAGYRVGDYLTNPPAREVIGEVKPE